MQRAVIFLLFFTSKLDAEVRHPVPLKPVFLMQGTDGRDAEFLSAILDERQVIHHLRSQWLETGEYRKYALVAIAGVPEEPNFKQVTFSKEDLTRIDKYLKEGGSLLLMGPAARVFETGRGKRFLTRLLGKKQPPRGDSGDLMTVLIQEHPWIRHLLPDDRSKGTDTIQNELEEVEEADGAPNLLEDGVLSVAPVLYKQHPWLVRSKFYWLYPARGKRIIGKRSGKTALYQLPVGKGQIICTAWDMFRWENPELGDSPELEAQLEILRRMCSSLPLYKRDDYLKDRSAIIGRDPFAWHRDHGLTRPQPDISWYQSRGITPDAGPSGKDEAVSRIQLDAALDESESTFFHLSNFRTARTIRVIQSVLKTKTGEELPAGSLRVRVQKAFSTEMLAAALYENGSLADYGPIESLDEAKALAAHLLKDGNSNLGKPIWLFDLDQAGKRAGNEFTFEMDEGSHVSIWLTYEPRKGIVPGVYEGKLRIEGGSRTVLSVTLKIRKIRTREQALFPVAIDSKATGTFERSDASKDEVWLEVRPGDTFTPESVYSKLWEGLPALADYKGVVGLHVLRDARVRYPLTFRWGKKHVMCAALEAIRDAVDSARCYRFLTRKARTIPVASAAAGLELELIRLEIGNQKSLSDFNKLHSTLLDIIEVHTP